MGSLVTASPPLEGISRICIIGAGASGLAFYKFLSGEQHFSHIDVFESRSHAGGIWNYSSSQSLPSIPLTAIDAHSGHETPINLDPAGRPIFSTPIYDHLCTNVNKGLMEYSDLRFPEGTDLFPARDVVLSYLRSYAEDISHNIRFSTQVRSVVPKRSSSGREEWDVVVKDLLSGHEESHIYDAIVVANGHYNVPAIPSIPGLENWTKAYPEAVQHAKYYKTASKYQGKKVVVVGNAASGADIGSQIKEVCQKPLLWSIRTPTDAFGHDEREEVGTIEELIVEDRAIRFAGGRIEKHVDTVLFCTGYLYSYPFLEALKPPIVTDGTRVRGLFKHLVNIYHPTLVFPLATQKILPFQTSEVQAAAISKLWSGKITLPTEEIMRADEQSVVEERGDGWGFHSQGAGGDMVYDRALRDWIQTAASPNDGKQLRILDERHYWERENLAKIRLDYAKHVGVKTLEELGWDYEAATKDGVEKEKTAGSKKET